MAAKADMPQVGCIHATFGLLSAVSLATRVTCCARSAVLARLNALLTHLTAPVSDAFSGDDGRDHARNYEQPPTAPTSSHRITSSHPQPPGKGYGVCRICREVT